MNPPLERPEGPEGPPASRSSWRRWLVALVVLGGAAYGLLRLSESQRSAAATARPAPRGVPVVAAAVRRGDMPVYLTGLGTVTAFNTVTVQEPRRRPADQGRRFRKGSSCTQGDLLAEIDPRPFEVQLTQAEGQLARDRRSCKDAQADLERYAQPAVAKAVDRAAAVRHPGRAGRPVSKAASKLDQALIDSAKLQLTYCHITAPISGRIGLRLVDVGNMVHATDQNGLLVITQMQPITVLFTMPEDDLPPVLPSCAPASTCRWRRTTAPASSKIATGLAADGRQPDRSEHRHHAPEGGLRQRGRRRCSRISSSTCGCCSTSRRKRDRPVGGRFSAARKARSSTSSRPDQTVEVRPVTRRARRTAADAAIDDGLHAGRAGGRRRRRQAARRAARCKRVRRGDGSSRRPRRTHEPVAAVHPAAGRDLAADGRRSCWSGVVAYRQLPVSALPEVDYPTIQVLTFYPGASPDVMASSVTAPLERQFGQVPGLNQMTSTSSFGSSVITLQFVLDLNIDVAEQEVQAAINAAAPTCRATCRTRRSTARPIRPTRRS